MADISQGTPSAPTTAEGFMADRLSFWASATKFMTNVAIAIVVLLVLLWWFLV
jgi:hypothetical protein